MPYNDPNLLLLVATPHAFAAAERPSWTGILLTRYTGLGSVSNPGGTAMMTPRGRPALGALGLLLMLLAVSVGLASARRGRRGLGNTIKQGPLVPVRGRLIRR